MAGATPFSQLAGVPLTIYLAPVGEAFADVDTTPAGNWVEFGQTDGEQTFTHDGDAVKFYDNAHQGPVKAVRPQEDPMYAFTLVDLTLEHYDRVLDDVADVTSAPGPPAIKTMPLKRGATPNEYALLARGSLASPYYAGPAQYQIYRGIFGNSPAPTFSKDGRAALEVEFWAIEDDNQSDANRLGVLVAQTA
jgi:hypothetical protein